MRPLICAIAAGMLVVAAFHANAAAVAYGEAFDTLYKIDLDARTASAVGQPTTYQGQTIGNISGLTTREDGSQYAIWGGYKQLLRIDPASGAATVVGSLGLAGQGSGQFDSLDLGMTADCNGTLWLTSGVLKQVWTVDPASGATTLVGSTGKPIAGLAANADGLFGSGSRGDHGFYKIDRKTGAATLIGDFGPAASSVLNSVSMGFDADGTLWAVLNYVPPNSGNVVPDWSDLATIDPKTGAMTVLGPITGPDSLRQVGMKGFTVGPPQCRRRPDASGPVAAPVDAPWALALLALLLGAGAYRGVRRQRRA